MTAEALPDELISFTTPIVDRAGQPVERASHTCRCSVEQLANDVSIEMVLLPGGTYWMGSPPGEGYPDEHPRHLVFMHPFAIGRCLVTQAQWQAVMESLPPCRFTGAQLPVERISWHASVEFCRRLAKKTGRPYRLPSESEWEYACRAGTTTPFAFGPTITSHLVNYCAEHTYLQEPPGRYRHTSNPAGDYPPNRFGLYDVHGNLWEWCADAWHEDYVGAPLNGQPWEERREKMRVARGGSWHEPPQNCRSATRLRWDPGEADDMAGLRIALDWPGD